MSSASLIALRDDNPMKRAVVPGLGPGADAAALVHPGVEAESFGCLGGRHREQQRRSVSAGAQYLATYENVYKLTHVRGPSGMPVMLAEELKTGTSDATRGGR